MLDYYEPEGNAPASEKCARSGAKARAVAMSIEDRRTRQMATSRPPVSAMTVYGISPASVCGSIRPRSWEHSRSLPTCSAVSRIPRTCRGSFIQVLSLLEVGGGFYTLVPGVHLEDGKDKLGVFYLTELENAAGRPEKVCSWLKDYLRASHLRIEERLEKGHRADKHSEGLHQHLGPAHEISGVRSGISSRQAIPIGAVGCVVEFTAPVRDEQKKKLESLEVKV